MLRAAMIFLGMYLLSMALVTLATDLKEIQRHIEKQRQFEKIKNEIMKNIRDNGAQIPRPESPTPDITGGTKANRVLDAVTGDIHGVDVASRTRIHQPSAPGSGRMISIGKPASEELKKDGCLDFQLEKYNNNITSISPIKINLYMYVRKKRSRKNKRVVVPRISRHSRVKRKAKRRRSRRKNGRKIKLFVSNGNKRLAKLRMRVRKSGWLNIELPISQFPKKISVDDSFRLCLVCKRCNRRTKLYLYSNNKAKKERTSKEPIIPFILIKGRPILPPTYRHKRSHRTQVNNHDENSPCCHLETHEQTLSDWSPDIVSPVRVNISYCVNSCDVVYSDTTTLSHVGIPVPQPRDGSREHLSDQPRDRISQFGQCLPQQFKSLSFIYADSSKDGQLTYTSISNLIPDRCHWQPNDRKWHS